MSAERNLFDGEVDPFWSTPTPEKTSNLATLADQLLAGMPGDILSSTTIDFGEAGRCKLLKTEEAMLINGKLLELSTDQAFNIHDGLGVFNKPNRDARIQYHRDNNGYTGLEVDTPGYKTDIRIYKDARTRQNSWDAKLGVTKTNNRVTEGHLGAAIFCLQIMGLPDAGKSDANLLDWVLEEFREPGQHIEHFKDAAGSRDVLRDASPATIMDFIASAQVFIDKQVEGPQFVQSKILDMPDVELTVKRSYSVAEVDQGDPRIEVEYGHPAEPDSQFDTVEGYLSCGGGYPELWHEVELHDLASLPAKARDLRDSALDTMDLVNEYKRYQKEAESKVIQNQARNNRIREDVELGYWGLCQGGLQKVIGLLESVK